MTPLLRGKMALYRLFVRCGWVRGAFAGLRRLRDGGSVGSLAHLAIFDPHKIGPVQPDEALLLYALARMIRPRVIVEFGFNRGHSALNFALACPDAKVISYDIGEFPETVARRCLGPLPNFRFFRKSQTEFDPADAGNEPLDLVFIDAAHDLEINRETFRRIVPHLAPGAVVAVHDTGVWDKARFTAAHREFAALAPESWLDERRFQHQRDERLFVNWIGEAYPDFALLHLGTERVLRHGITLLQRTAPLPT